MKTEVILKFKRLEEDAIKQGIEVKVNGGYMEFYIGDTRVFNEVGMWDPEFEYENLEYIKGMLEGMTIAVEHCRKKWEEYTSVKADI